MKVFMCFIFLLVFQHAQAGEWVTLAPADLKQYEVAKEGALGSLNEGIYIRHKSSFATTLDCPKREFVVINDPKLADRALSSIMYAATTNKTIQLYVDGCNQGYLRASIFMVIM